MSEPRVLQLVGLQLVHEADAPALVAAHVEHDARGPRPRHGLERGVELRAAVAAARAEDVAGEALGVHADEHVLAVADVAADEGDVVGAVEHRLVADGEELAVAGRDLRLGDPRRPASRCAGGRR